MFAPRLIPRRPAVGRTWVRQSHCRCSSHSHAPRCGVTLSSDVGDGRPPDGKRDQPLLTATTHLRTERIVMSNRPTLV